MNDAGDAAGFFRYAPVLPGEHAFARIDGVVVPLEIPGRDSVALDMNNAGQVIGQTEWSSITSPQARGFVWHNGRSTLLEPPEGFLNSSAAAINSNGDIAGINRPCETRRVTVRSAALPLAKRR